MSVLTWALLGYFAGSLPSAWAVAVVTGKRALLEDVRRNVGEADAHLILKQAGGRQAEVAAALDVLKGLVPVLIAVNSTGPYEIAACAVAAVAGHCWPPVYYTYAGRGLATAAGSFLGMLPLEMVIAGIVRLMGSPLKAGGLSSTVGFAAIPVVAWLRGQPAPYLLAGVVINVLISLRRLEGVEEDVARGASLPKAIARRVVLDASTPQTSQNP
jgi:acyl phosphate:glycerol-3-phosphate acyltransferase